MHVNYVELFAWLVAVKFGWGSFGLNGNMQLFFVSIVIFHESRSARKNLSIFFLYGF